MESTPSTGTPQIQVPCPRPGTYYLRTFHDTFASFRQEDVTTVPMRAVGNFERFAIRNATPEEVQVFVSYETQKEKRIKDSQSQRSTTAGSGGLDQFLPPSRTSSVSSRLSVAKLSRGSSYFNANDTTSTSRSVSASQIVGDASTAPHGQRNEREKTAAVTRSADQICLEFIPDTVASLTLGVLDSDGGGSKGDMCSSAYVLEEDNEAERSKREGGMLLGLVPSASVASRASSSSATGGSDISTSRRYPLVTIRGVATDHYLCVNQSGGGDASSGGSLSSLTVGWTKGTTTAFSIFTIRPHPRIHPKGRFFMLHNEAFDVNISAVITDAVKAEHNSLASNASPRINPNVSGPKSFGVLPSAAEWCGFEFLPAADIFTTAATLALAAANAADESDSKGASEKLMMSASASSSASFYSSALLPLLPSLPSGTYAVTAFCTNARLAFVGGGRAGNTGPVEFTTVSSTDLSVNEVSGIVLEPIPPTDGRAGGRRNLYAIRRGPSTEQQWGNSVADPAAYVGIEATKFLGVEKATKFHTRPVANAWEIWRIEPHPTQPYHHTIYNVSFDRYIKIDPSVQNSNGMLLKAEKCSSQPGPWEAFYFGPFVPYFAKK